MSLKFPGSPADGYRAPLGTMLCQVGFLKATWGRSLLLWRTTGKRQMRKHVTKSSMIPRTLYI